MIKDNQKGELSLKNQQKNEPLNFDIPQVLHTIDKELHINRTFNFPRKTVFKAFTVAKHLQKWWGPFGSENSFCEINLYIGGKLIIRMNGINKDRYFEGQFFEIKENEKLVFSLSVIENGESVFETLNTVTFNEFDSRKTELSLIVQVVKANSEILPFAIKGLNEGWSQGIEKLDKYLIETFNGHFNSE